MYVRVRCISRASASKRAAESRCGPSQGPAYVHDDDDWCCWCTHLSRAVVAVRDSCWSSWLHRSVHARVCTCTCTKTSAAHPCTREALSQTRTHRGTDDDLAIQLYVDRLICMLYSVSPATGKSVTKNFLRAPRENLRYNIFVFVHFHA